MLQLLVFVGLQMHWTMVGCALEMQDIGKFKLVADCVLTVCVCVRQCNFVRPENCVGSVLFVSPGLNHKKAHKHIINGQIVSCS